MCGIAGYLSTTDTGPTRLSNALTIMGLFMEQRGRDSWGWTDGTNIVKSLGKYSGSFTPSLLGSPSALLHTRYATFGEKTQENSHPWNIKGIVGMHNGMIYNHKEVATKFGIEYKVDSEVIFHLIADGVELTELEGYGTIVFYKDGTLHLGRLSTRGDLELAMTDAGWMFASTKEAVEVGARLAGIEIKFWQDTKKGELYYFDGADIFLSDLKLEVSERKATPITPWQSSSPGHYGVTYRDGRTFFSGGSYATGYWDNQKQKWVEFDKDPYSRQFPLPTAQTTTFTSEPGSDADEVIDVDGENEAAYIEAAEMIMQGRAPVDELDEVYFDETDFTLMSASERKSDPRLQQCSDCLEVIFEEEPVHVYRPTKDTFCADCFRRNYAPQIAPSESSDALFDAEFDRQVAMARASAQQHEHMAALPY